MTTAEIIAISSAVAGTVGVLATKGVDALIRWKKANSDETLAKRAADNQVCSLEDERADRAYKDVIKIHERTIEAQGKRIDGQQEHIKTLEIEVSELRKAFDREMREHREKHEDCIKMNASLQTQIDILMRDKGARDFRAESDP